MFVLVFKVSSKGAIVIESNLIENVHRENLSAIEKGNCCKQLLEKYPEKYPSLAKLAEKLGLSQSTITEWLTLVGLPTEVQRLIAPETLSRRIPEGKIDYHTAVQIVRKERIK